MKEPCKYVVAIAPAAVIDNASATVSAVDCIGSAYAELPVQLGATDIAITALKLTECDTSGGSYTDVPNATFASTGLDSDGAALSLPSATDDNKVHVFRGSLLGRKRYLKLVVTFGDGEVGGFVACTARLSNLAYGPDLTTDIANGRVCQF